MNEVVLSDERLISTTRAAELTGYARDYLGQLCRNGTLKCRMIGKQWFVDVESLKAYAPQMKKPKKSDFYVPPEQKTQEVPKVEDVRSGTFVFGDDEYIPTQKAAQLFGYSQDYVGQLARSGEVPAKKIGRRWFIAKKALQRHKEEKERLLQAVQAESVTIQKPEKRRDPLERLNFSVRYYREDGTPLLPHTQAQGAIHHRGLHDTVTPDTSSERFQALMALAAKKQEKTYLGNQRLASKPSVTPPTTHTTSIDSVKETIPLKKTAAPVRVAPVDSDVSYGSVAKVQTTTSVSWPLLAAATALFMVSFVVFVLTALWFISVHDFIALPFDTSVLRFIESLIPADTVLYQS